MRAGDNAITASSRDANAFSFYPILSSQYYVTEHIYIFLTMYYRIHLSQGESKQSRTVWFAGLVLLQQA